MGVFENIIVVQRMKVESILQNLQVVKFVEGWLVGVLIISLFGFQWLIENLYIIFIFLDVIVQLFNINDLMKEEVRNLCEMIDVLNVRYKEYIDQI